MTDLQKQFQEEKDVSFDGIPINGVHLEYITWLEAQIQALRIHGVVGQSEQLVCDVCEQSVKVNKAGNWIICSECGYQKEAN